MQERNRTGSRVEFLLDEESTRTLRNTRDARYRVPDNARRYRIPGNGIPVSCPDLIED
ncbi:hypothetical protein ACFYWH_42125 [Streptomyces sp. NPDC003737]|uniref:hypothetical protein n=1 Tax=Streptomyces sp. NPDC003737 TaxID=3364685 RepID=UPI0036ABCAB0